MEDPLTVTQLNNLIKQALKVNFPNKVQVIGEISNLKISRNNLFLTIKDQHSTINVTIWSFIKRFPNLQLENGNKIIVTGYITLYSQGSTNQINGTHIEIVGTGDLHKDYVLTKEYYEEIGYFKNDNKKPLPKQINRIGVITAKDGAALKDFLYVLENGGYRGNVCIKDAIVQGKDCPVSIVTSLQYMDSIGLDIIVITRGGGSFEDLFGFSHSEVIEAIHKTNTPTISAIGHEVDFMLSDFVADIRAPTPSIAGEIIATHQKGIFDIGQLENMLKGYRFEIIDGLNSYRNRIKQLQETIINPLTLIYRYRQYFDQILETTRRNLMDEMALLKHKYMDLKNSITLENPEEIFKRGYCVVVDEDGNCISSSDEYHFVKDTSNKKLKLIFIDGSVVLSHPIDQVTP